MTIIDHDSISTPQDQAPGVGGLWTQVESGFWVGQQDGSFLGSVERQSNRYFARNFQRHYVGEYDSLARAMLAVWRLRP